MEININIPKLSREKYVKYGVIAVIAVVVLSLVNVFWGSGYKTPIKKSIVLINKKTEEAIEYRKYSTLSTQYKFEVMHSEAISQDGDTYKNYVEALKEKFGDDYKVRYSVDEANKYTAKKLEELATEISIMYEGEVASEEDSLSLYEEEWQEEDVELKQQKKLKKAFEKYVKECSKIKVTAAYEIDILCTIKGSEGKETFDVKDMIIAKVNGKWIFVDGLLNPYTVHSKSTK